MYGYDPDLFILPSMKQNQEVSKCQKILLTTLGTEISGKLIGDKSKADLFSIKWTDSKDIICLSNRKLSIIKKRPEIWWLAFFNSYKYNDFISIFMEKMMKFRTIKQMLWSVFSIFTEVCLTFLGRCWLHSFNLISSFSRDGLVLC